MQEEVNQKTISLSVKAAKVTADVLKQMLRKYLADRERSKQRKQQTKAAEKESHKDVRPRGKQTLRQLMDQGSELKNIEVTDSNIKSFDRVARKYGIDYSLKKDVKAEPPRYLVFFKARDVDVMTAAFQEYAGISLQKAKRPSLRKRLVIAKEKAAAHRERQKQKEKDRGQDL